MSSVDFPTRRRLAVFCGSRTGHAPQLAAAATELGTLLARQGIGLVYGGARVGLMHAVAQGALQAGGEVVGVMCRQLVEVEDPHPGLSELVCVDSLAARKKQMLALADGCVALPGGLGTLDELFEAWTAVYVGASRHPIGLLNVEGYYNDLLRHLDLQVVAGFLDASHRDALHVTDDSKQLLAMLTAAW